MTSYYDILGVSPNASLDDIRAAYDARYERLTKIIQHSLYDEKKKFQARVELNELEQAIAVLLDPAKRAEYDRTIGVSNDGVVDPDNRGAWDQKHYASSPFPPPTPNTERMDAWVCPQCNHANRVNTFHCEECGYKIGMSWIISNGS